MEHSANLPLSLHTVHTNMSNRNIADPMRERCREIWWTIYILDSHMAALMGVPQSLSEHDVTAQLPEFAAHTSKSLALGIHVKLARATSSILQSECPSFHGARCLDMIGIRKFDRPGTYANMPSQQSMAEMAVNQASSSTASKML
jgi:hypothetical protein